MDNIFTRKQKSQNVRERDGDLDDDFIEGASILITFMLIIVIIVHISW